MRVPCSQTSIKQTMSQEIWGGIPSKWGGGWPKVQAYFGTLDATVKFDGSRGVEFVTFARPDDYRPVLYVMANWSLGHNPSVASREGGDMAAINVFLYKNTPLGW